MLPKAGAL